MRNKLSRLLGRHLIEVVIALLVVISAFLSCEDLGILPEPAPETLPTLSVNDLIVSEGTSVSFTISLNQIYTSDVTVTCTFSDGLATGGSDYSGSNGARTITAGTLTTLVPVTISADALSEGDETFTLTLSNPVHATIANGVGTAIISGSDLPILNVNDLTIAEGQNGSFTVTSTIISSVNISFNWQLQTGTAEAGADFSGGSGSSTIFAGTNSAGVPVQINSDTISEGDENFTVVISGAVQAIIGDGTGIGTISANTAPVSFASQVRPLLTAHCAVNGCHGNGSSDGGLAMGVATYAQVRNASGTHGEIISNPPVGANSNLYRVVTSSPPSGIPRMPDGGPMFTTAQQLLIRDWIDQGAPDN